jgi:hypothetical protein
VQMEDFRSMMEHCRLNDMGFSGPHFTWFNRRHGDLFTNECLGRAMANFPFALKFSQLVVEVMATRSSDHAPLHVILKDPHGTRRGRRGLFRFES